jgi:hypothetical protein
MINDIVGGEHYFINPQTKTAQVLKVPNQPATRQSPVSAPDSIFSLGGGGGGGDSASGHAGTDGPATTVSLGQKEIEGVTTIGTRREQTFAPGTVGNDKPITVTVEQWYSPDLGVVVLASQQTSTGAELTYRLHDIKRSEPDAALFTIPADYTRHEGQPMMITATATHN